MKLFVLVLALGAVAAQATDCVNGAKNEANETCVCAGGAASCAGDDAGASANCTTNQFCTQGTAGAVANAEFSLATDAVCATVTGMCTGNSDSSADITCTEGTPKAAGTEGTDVAACCWIFTGQCTGNTGGTGDVDCSTEATNTENKGITVDGTDAAACCQAPTPAETYTGYCAGNTVSSEDVTCSGNNTVRYGDKLGTDAAACCTSTDAVDNDAVAEQMWSMNCSTIAAGFNCGASPLTKIACPVSCPSTPILTAADYEVDQDAWLQLAVGTDKCKTCASMMQSDFDQAIGYWYDVFCPVSKDAPACAAEKTACDDDADCSIAGTKGPLLTAASNCYSDAAFTACEGNEACAAYHTCYYASIGSHCPAGDDDDDDETVVPATSQSDASVIVPATGLAALAVVMAL